MRYIELMLRRGAQFEHIVSDETRAKIGNANRGRYKSGEQKRKISLAMMGNNNTLGRRWHLSEEVLRKRQERLKQFMSPKCLFCFNDLVGLNHLRQKFCNKKCRNRTFDKFHPLR